MSVVHGAWKVLLEWKHISAPAEIFIPVPPLSPQPRSWNSVDISESIVLS